MRARLSWIICLFKTHEWSYWKVAAQGRYMYRICHRCGKYEIKEET